MNCRRLGTIVTSLTRNQLNLLELQKGGGSGPTERDPSQEINLKEISLRNMINLFANRCKILLN